LLVHRFLDKFNLAFDPTRDLLNGDGFSAVTGFLFAFLDSGQCYLVPDNVLLPVFDFFLTFLNTAVKIGNVPVLGSVSGDSGCLRSVSEVVALSVFIEASCVLFVHSLPPTSKRLTTGVTGYDRLGEERYITAHTG
jgi:hypothetical protein